MDQTLAFALKMAYNRILNMPHINEIITIISFNHSFQTIFCFVNVLNE